jgi:hypothetical protein
VTALVTPAASGTPADPPWISMMFVSVALKFVCAREISLFCRS